MYTLDPTAAKRKRSEFLRQWESIGICNDFIFCKVMQDEDLLMGLIRIILPDLDFQRIEVQSQKSVEIGQDIHGVRFDIFATGDNGTVIEIEMQVLDTGNLPKRLRYYSSMIDTQMLEKGVPYHRLRDSYTIIICPFDQYGLGLHRYTFTNRCSQATELEMGDGATKIVLNAVGTADDIDGGLRAFLDYVAGKPSENPYVQKVDHAVRLARGNKEWRKEYMTLKMRDLENQEVGIQIGRKQGRAERDREKIAEMLQRGKSPQMIAEFCNYPILLVQEVEQSLGLVHTDL